MIKGTDKLTIAVTGCIGAGKSFVCNILAQYGIKVYDCDAAAKRLMGKSTSLINSLTALVGADVYKNGILQKAVLAQYILSSEENKQAVNAIIHPAVAYDFEHSGYKWLESAILFESGFINRTHIDKTVCVTAPLQTRINRIMERDNISHDKALEWINRQMSQEQIEELSDYTIINDGVKDIEQQIKELLINIYK